MSQTGRRPESHAMLPSRGVVQRVAYVQVGQIIFGPDRQPYKIKTVDDKWVTLKNLKLEHELTIEKKKLKSEGFHLAGTNKSVQAVRYSDETKAKAREALMKLRHSKQGDVGKSYTLEKVMGVREESHSENYNELMKMLSILDGEPKEGEEKSERQRYIELHGLDNLSAFVNKKNIPRVKYLEPAERHNYQVTVADGVVTFNMQAFDTSEMDTRASGKGWAMFVLSHDGKLYSSSQVVDKFHHSSFLAGGNAASAGEWQVRGGRIIKLKDKSGHYKPDSEMLYRMLIYLHGRGVDLKTFGVTPKSFQEHAQEFRADQVHDSVGEIPSEPALKPQSGSKGGFFGAVKKIFGK